MYFAYVTIPDGTPTTNGGTGSTPLGPRRPPAPGQSGTTRAILTFISDVRGLEDLAGIDQIAILRKTFAGVGGAAPRILAELDSAPLYFSALGRVSRTLEQGPHRPARRRRLLNATFGGGGTSLALIGAYVLAGELSRTDDESLALTRYEQFLRPCAESKDVSTRGTVLRMANPRTQKGIRALHGAAGVLAGPVGRTATKLLGQRGSGMTADGLQLPDYPPVEVVRHM